MRSSGLLDNVTVPVTRRAHRICSAIPVSGRQIAPQRLTRRAIQTASTKSGDLMMRAESTSDAIMSRAVLDCDELLTAADVAKALNLSVSCIRSWAREHKGPPHVRVGSQLRFPRVQFERWFSERKDPLVRAALSAGVSDVPLAQSGGAGNIVRQLIATAKPLEQWSTSGNRIVVELDGDSWLTALESVTRPCASPVSEDSGLGDDDDAVARRQLLAYGAPALQLISA